MALRQSARLPACSWAFAAQQLRSPHSRSCETKRAAATAALSHPGEAAVSGASVPRVQVDLPKNFDFTREEQLYQWWEQAGYFQPNPSAPGSPFVIPMPPPNVTGKLHMGHALTTAVQDTMVRYARMTGRKALFLPGTDHAGIATQSVVEKRLREQGINRQELGREAFVEKVWEWKEEYGGFITNQIRRLGASCDWTRERFTLDEGLSAAVAEAFFQLHGKGLIYRGSYMVNWSPALLTAVSDLEVDYVEEAGFMYHFRYPLADEPGGFLPVATTRPETIFGDTAVAVNPKDERYSQYIGRECVVPCSGGRLIKVIGDDYVDAEFGTGVLKITPGHDVNDYEIGKRRGLEIINIMNKDATLNAAAGSYAGLERFKARKAVWADMEEQGLAIKREPHTNRVPRSQRSGEVIEPLISEQWFVRATPLAEPALAAVADGRLRFLPERFEKTYNFWLEDIKDWCISRQLWWGHRIPVWYVFPSAADSEGSADGRCENYVVARNYTEACTLAQERHGAGCVLLQEQDVLDTWFSSGLWPFSIMGWPNTEAPDFKTYYPAQLLETAHDILFFWVARMVMMGLALTGEVPFATVYLHGLVRDDKGRKMSKSLGNVVDPLVLSAEFGTDALRYTMATGTSMGQDLNLSTERLAAGRNFTNKLWNAGKFILFMVDKAAEPSALPSGSAAAEDSSRADSHHSATSSSEAAAEWSRLATADFSDPQALAALPLSERWIISRLHQAIEEVSANHDKYDLNAAGVATYSFFWDEYADWFIEAAKARTYGEDSAAAATTRGVLVYVFERVLRLLHPFMPFVTEELWQALPHNGPALIVAPWPQRGLPVDAAAHASFEALKGVVRAVRNARAEYGVEVSRRIGLTIVAEDPHLRRALEAELPVIQLLARLEPLQSHVVATAAELGDTRGWASVIVGDGLQVLIPLAGLFDVVKEMARLSKQLAKAEKDVAGIVSKLSNPKFMERASPEVVTEANTQHAEALARLDLIVTKLQQLRAMEPAQGVVG